MKKKSYEDLILYVIYQYGGNASWYQIERELGFRGIGGRTNAIVIADKLVEKGMVEKHLDPGSNYSVYITTDLGVDKVFQLVEELGIEAFSRTVQNRDDYE